MEGEGDDARWRGKGMMLDGGRKGDEGAKGRTSKMPASNIYIWGHS